MLTAKGQRRLGNIVLSFIVCLLAIACSSLANNQERIELNIGTAPTFPPFAMRENRDRVVGFEIDLIQAIAERAEIEIFLDKDFSFPELIPALEEEKIDGVISGMTMTPQRAETVAFSRPYFQSGLAIAIRDEDERINNENNLKNKIIAVQIGTKGARKSEKIQGAKVIKFSSISLALHELKDGNIDAVIHDIPAILHTIKIGNLDGLRIVGGLLTTEYYGIALPKNSPYIDPINDALEELIADRTYENLYRQWFNSEPPPLPETAPALE
jgi:arginine/lysine/histidine/glutamine transport system substrate-binding/permease protein